MLPWEKYAGTVRDSAEFRRILSLPRRSMPPRGTDRLTELFRTPESTQKLRPIQAQALAELHLVKGLFGLVRVGGGKTLITYLAPEMLDVERPLLLIPAKLREKTIRDFEELSKNWRRPRVPATIFSYEKLGRAQWANFLGEYQPDMIIADEGHRLKNVMAAVTRRVGRYMSDHPTTHFIALSGTLTRRSLMDFVHIAEWCLGSNTPVPLQYEDLIEWCLALDEDSIVTTGKVNSRFAPGVLVEFANNKERPTIKDIRLGFRKRLIATPGVVATDESPIDASLTLFDWWPDYHFSENVLNITQTLLDEWKLPNDQVLISAADLWRHMRELALGFYYKWEPVPPEWWLEPRKIWSAFVRRTINYSQSVDSEKQVADLHQKSDIYQAWAAVKDQYTPQVEAIWVDKSVVLRAAQWTSEEGIVWVGHSAVADELEKLGVPYYGHLGLNKDKEPIEIATGGIAASIEANKEGRNLQHYNRNLILSPPTTGVVWEQLLGRTHRDGQRADEVSVEIFFGCSENRKAFTQALSDAQYQHNITGSPQKLLEATIAF